MVLIQCSLGGLIKFYTSIIRLNRLNGLLGRAQKKALLEILIKTFLQKCVLNADAAFMHGLCLSKNSVRLNGF